MRLASRRIETSVASYDPSVDAQCRPQDAAKERDGDALDLGQPLTVVVEEAGPPGGRIIARTLPSLPRPTRTLQR